MSVLDVWAEQAVWRALNGIDRGTLMVSAPSGQRVFGHGDAEPALLQVHAPRFFRRVISSGEIGLGEAYMDGDWTTPDLVGLVRLMLANREVLGRTPAIAGWLSRVRDSIAHRLRGNTLTGSRRNIRAHYDLGNEFFRLFLDQRLMYSSAIYARAGDSLEAAQTHKLQTICDKLDLSPGDHVLEIGSGWGGFAVFAAQHYGCRVTTTTISHEQHAHASRLAAEARSAGAQITVLFEDYRNLKGKYDKIVSIEMFEAVGVDHYDDFFSACDRLLERDGVMLLQTITVDDWRFREYRSAPNWISKYIFPGAELASVAEILASLARTSRLSLYHAEQIGTHYARTLRDWRARFHRQLDEVRAQGFDERFIRMWDLYLGYCEAAFHDRHIGDVQLVLTKDANRRVLYGEPWEPRRAVTGFQTQGAGHRVPASLVHGVPLTGFPSGVLGTGVHGVPDTVVHGVPDR
jgi:cyclopropane-fatty-acyl-phospholipid synthase